LEDLGLSYTPWEDGLTFEENAMQKAVETANYIRRYTLQSELSDYIVLADDSGLVIDALDGKPGVDSSLFLGVDTTYEVRNAYIIEQMKDVPEEKRTARFVCAVACILPDGERISTSATMEGRIAYTPTGVKGFGYDPVFLLPEENRTMAQLTLEEKNAISHRGKAMMHMLQTLEVACPWKS